MNNFPFSIDNLYVNIWFCWLFWSVNPNTTISLYLAKRYFAEAPKENVSPAKCLISKFYISPRRPLRMPRLRNSRFRNYIFGGGLYMTLGPKFYIFSVLSPRICFCFVKPYCIAGIAAFFEILLLALSKHVLKPSGISFQKFASGFGFASYVYHDLLPQEGD